jgi:hypothetical protein
MLYVIAASRVVAEDHFSRLGQELPDYRLIRDPVDAQGLRPNPAVDTVLRLTFDEITDEAWAELTLHRG